MKNLVFVVDYGTSNVRVNAIDVKNGATEYSHSEKYHPLHLEPGIMELDPEDMWTKTQICMESVTGAMDADEDRIAAISFSVIGDSFIPIAADGEAMHNLILCFDARGEEEAQEISEKVGPEKILSLIGDIYEPGSTGSKILYFKRHFPEADAGTAIYGTLQQYALAQLGLPMLNDITLASRKSIMDDRNMVWSKEIMDAVGITEESLGGVILPTECAGEITSFGSIPLPYPVPVFPGAHDADVGYIGLGIGEGLNSAAAEVAGTFDHIGLMISGYENCHEKFPDFDIWSSRGPLPDSTVCLSAFAGSGALLEWFMTEINRDSSQAAYKDLWDHVEFDGKGTVWVAPGLQLGKGAIEGLSVTTTRYDLFKAIIETLTFETRRCIELCGRLTESGLNRIRIGGGGAREEKWVQLRADITGCVYERMQEIEASSLGSAMLAAVGCGIYKDTAEAAEHMTALQKEFVPDPAVKALYEERYQEYLRRYYGNGNDQV